VTIYGEKIMAGNVTEFNDANFQNEVIDSSDPVLVDFWAPWCGPCRMIAPLVEELATEYKGSVKIGKINIDDSPSAATQYGVSSIPTLIIFKGGEVVDRFVGVQPKSRLQAALEEARG
jgi:thioredoxin 1